MTLRIVSCILLLLSTSLAISQITYEKGYIINNNGDKIDGLIKNIDWKNNPNAINFKKIIDDKPTVYKKNEVKEFAIEPNIHFKRYTVKVDYSNRAINDLDQMMSPNYKQETVFLKTLIDGEASLLYYENSNIRTFYYLGKEQNPIPLIYKKYITPENAIKENKGFINQLSIFLQCECIGKSEFLNLKYKYEDILEIFKAYNNCLETPSIVYTGLKTNRKKFGLKLGFGIHQSQISPDKDSSSDLITTFEYPEEIGVRVNVELEFFLPFNKNKWSLYTGPSYQSYSAKQNFQNQDQKITYSTLQISLGGRHYIYLTKNSKLFLNLSSIISYRLSDEDLIISDFVISSLRNDTYAIAAGIGFQTGRFSIDVQQIFKHRIAEELIQNIVQYESVSINLGYSIF